MTHPAILCMAVAAALALPPLPAMAEQGDLPPGLRSAALLPGWTAPDGARMLALQLELEPGWKTYWRSPGDSGLPPHLEWQGSDNLGDIALHWPAPQAIRSGETLEMGYHDRLILPFTATPADPDLPITVRAQIHLGLCRDICVPVSLDLTAPAAGSVRDPLIAGALAAEPRQLDQAPICRVSPLADGMRVAMALQDGAATLTAIELTDSPQVWVSGADVVHDNDGAWSVVEMVGPSAKPFALNERALRLTVIPEDGSSATETTGCAPG